jgi:hypothetical protein
MVYLISCIYDIYTYTSQAFFLQHWKRRAAALSHCFGILGAENHDLDVVLAKVYIGVVSMYIQYDYVYYCDTSWVLRITT